MLRTDGGKDAHKDAHSEQGALRGEHPGRSRNPVIKVTGLAWLEFEKPDLDGTEAFANAFGLTTAARTATELQLRGTDPGGPCVLIRRGASSRLTAIAFTGACNTDLTRLADATGSPVTALPETIGGVSVNLRDPNGFPVRVVSGTHRLPELPGQHPHVFNVDHDRRRTNATQRPPRTPARVQRLGHVVLQVSKYVQALDWYLDHFGLIVSDFQYYIGQRERGPVMSFIRCDRGSMPSDHHTLAMGLGPVNRYLHSAYEVCDLDALAAGGEYLADRGYRRSWGIGRHIQGSQIFDYWRDPDGIMVEHYTDGDVFDCTLEPGWAPFAASGLAQWGPAPTADFLGTTAKDVPRELRSMLGALRGDNEWDVRALAGLLKASRG